MALVHGEEGLANVNALVVAFEGLREFESIFLVHLSIQRFLQAVFGEL